MNTNKKEKKEKFILKNNAVHKRFWQIGIRTFFVFLFVIAFLGLLLPLRPKESELEKRELSKFPKPTVSTVLNGEFFSDISTWYADTFPFRETLMSANAKMKKLYGITTQEIYGDAAQGDEIPDADALRKKRRTFRRKMELSMRNRKNWVRSILPITAVLNFTASAGPVPTPTSI